MTTNQTIDGVPRSVCHACATYSRDACCPVCDPAAQPRPDPVLCKFYDAEDWTGLVRELVCHVAQLQESAKRNVKPWEDTFPPTLLPAYVERVNAENAAAQPQGDRLGAAAEFVQKLIDSAGSQPSIATGYLSDILDVLVGSEVDGNSQAPKPRGEPVAWIVESPRSLEHVQGIAWDKVQADRYKLAGWKFTPLYSEQPAPVAVVMPERPHASEEEQQNMTEYEIGIGHGACEMRDKIKALNPGVKP